jgi:polyhydroxybutyrate depolymerase
MLHLFHFQSLMCSFILIMAHDVSFFAMGVRLSEGCLKKTALQTATMENITIDVDDWDRNFLLYLPSSYDSKEPLPLVLNFHGTPSNAENQYYYTEMYLSAEANGFIVVFPNGVEEGFNARSCCVDHNLDDEAFSRAIVDWVGEEACVDLDQVFATGWSNGGYMAYYLACKASDVFAAIAPVGALIAVYPDEDCSPSNPPRVLAFNEVYDFEVDYCGVLNDEFGISAEELVAVFAKKQGCADEVGVSYSDGEVVCRSHKGCPPGKNATLCTITRNFTSHSWPGAESDDYAPEVGTIDIDGNEEIWRFFSQSYPQSDDSLLCDSSPSTLCGVNQTGNVDCVGLGVATTLPTGALSTFSPSDGSSTEMTMGQSSGLP